MSRYQKIHVITFWNYENRKEGPRLLLVSTFVKLYVLISFEDQYLLNNKKLDGQKGVVIGKGIGDHEVHAEESRFNVLMSSDVFPVRGKPPLVKDEM